MVSCLLLFDSIKSSPKIFFGAGIYSKENIAVAVNGQRSLLSFSGFFFFTKNEKKNEQERKKPEF